MGPVIERIIPGGRGNTRDPVLGCNTALVDGHLGQLAGVFIPFKRMSDYGRDVDLTTKIAREITKVSALLDDRASAKGMLDERICANSYGAPTSSTCPTNLLYQLLRRRKHSVRS